MPYWDWLWLRWLSSCLRESCLVMPLFHFLLPVPVVTAPRPPSLDGNVLCSHRNQPVTCPQTCPQKGREHWQCTHTHTQTKTNTHTCKHTEARSAAEVSRGEAEVAVSEQEQHVSPVWVRNGPSLAVERPPTCVVFGGLITINYMVWQPACRHVNAWDCDLPQKRVLVCPRLVVVDADVVVVVQDQNVKDKALQSMASMSSAQIVSATAIHSKLGLPGLPRPSFPGAAGVRPTHRPTHNDPQHHTHAHTPPQKHTH